MKQFCKLFGPDDDQILAMLTENDEGSPVIDIYFGVEGLLPVKMSLGYDTEERDQIISLQAKLSVDLGDDE